MFLRIAYDFSQLLMIFSNFVIFEILIDHIFVCKRFLFEIVIHFSHFFIFNIFSYQRFEYFNDAIFNYFVTIIIFFFENRSQKIFQSQYIHIFRVIVVSAFFFAFRFFSKIVSIFITKIAIFDLNETFLFIFNARLIFLFQFFRYTFIFVLIFVFNVTRDRFAILKKIIDIAFNHNFVYL